MLSKENTKTKKTTGAKIPAPFVLIPEYTNERKRFYRATLNNGELLSVEIVDCQSDLKARNSLAYNWKKAGYINTKRGQKIYKYKSVQTYTEEPASRFPCMGLYNPTHTGGRLNFKHDQETDSQLLKRIIKRSLKNKIVLTDAEISAGFDSLENLTPQQFKRKEKQAKKIYQSTFYKYAKFEDQSAFISSSSVPGFYFPNLGARLRCVAFRKGRAVLCYSEGEQ